MTFINRTFLAFLFVLPSMAFSQSKFSPADEALKQFNSTKAAFEKQYDGIIDEPRVFTGDLNGDHLPDCIISFVMNPKEGGNAIIASINILYLNTGKGMKRALEFPEFKFCYGIDRIQNGLIYIKQYECAPPYMTFTKASRLAYRDGKIIEVLLKI